METLIHRYVHVIKQIMHPVVPQDTPHQVHTCSCCEDKIFVTCNIEKNTILVYLLLPHPGTGFGTTLYKYMAFAEQHEFVNWYHTTTRDTHTLLEY